MPFPSEGINVDSRPWVGGDGSRARLCPVVRERPSCRPVFLGGPLLSDAPETQTNGIRKQCNLAMTTVGPLHNTWRANLQYAPSARPTVVAEHLWPSASTPPKCGPSGVIPTTLERCIYPSSLLPTGIVCPRHGHRPWWLPGAIPKSWRLLDARPAQCREDRAHLRGRRS
jgi:hypothetical protein